VTTTVPGGASCAPGEAFPCVMKEIGGATAQLQDCEVAFKNRASGEVSREWTQEEDTTSTFYGNRCTAGLDGKKIFEGLFEFFFFFMLFNH